MSKTTAERVRELLARGFTQAQIVTRLGVSRQAVSQVASPENRRAQLARKARGRGTNPKRRYHCSVCGQAGHVKTTHHLYGGAAE